MIDRDNKIPNCPNPDCVYQKVRDELNRTTRSTVLLARDEEEIDHILHHYQGTSITLPTRHPIQIVIPYGQVHINSYTAPTPVLTPTTDSSDQQQGVGEQVRVPTQQSGRGGQLGGLGCGRLYGLSIIDTNAGFVNAAQRPQEPQDQHRQQPASVSRTNGFGTSSPVAPDQAQSRVPNCPYVPGIDPRYFQPVRFSGPSYPNPVPPQHSWDLPRGVTLGLHPRPRTNYAAYFDELGASYSPGTSDRFGHAILQNSRGVFLKPIPSSATLASICDNIRGGALERVDFHDFQGRTCVGVYFISAEEAMKYIKFCREQGGVYWPESGTVSNVEGLLISPFSFPQSQQSGVLTIHLQQFREPRADTNLLRSKWPVEFARAQPAALGCVICLTTWTWSY